MGGGSIKPSAADKAGAGAGASTPNLFSAAQQYMPGSYFGSGKITDPTSILNAYMQHLPAFMNAAKSVSNMPPNPPVITTPGVQTSEMNRQSLYDRLTKKGGS